MGGGGGASAQLQGSNRLKGVTWAATRSRRTPRDPRDPRRSAHGSSALTITSRQRGLERG